MSRRHHPGLGRIHRDARAAIPPHDRAHPLAVQRVGLAQRARDPVGPGRATNRDSRLPRRFSGRAFPRATPHLSGSGRPSAGGTDPPADDRRLDDDRVGAQGRKGRSVPVHERPAADPHLQQSGRCQKPGDASLDHDPSAVHAGTPPRDGNSRWIWCGSLSGWSIATICWRISNRRSRRSRSAKNPDEMFERDLIQPAGCLPVLAAN